MSAYYNENDPYAAQWLRNLVAAGLISAGDVDERSIVDVQADDINVYKQVHLFAGIAGWPLALRLARWPDDEPVWTGSCPCQPFSNAGKRQGEADKRHLWPEFRRLIAECSPSTVIGEQVASKLGREWLAGVRADLEELGYAVGAGDLCAASAGAPHIRQRLFWVADTAEPGRDELPQRADKPDRRPAPEPGRLCGAEWLGDAIGARLEERSGFGRDDEPECAAAERAGGDARGLGDAAGERCEEPSQRDERAQQSGQQAPFRSDADGSDFRAGDCGVGDAASERGREGWPGGQPGPAAWLRDETQRHYWEDAVWLPCLDGKARRVESSIFPLAYSGDWGVGSRVGLLRGAGNAIVPALAAEFIIAFLECRPRADNETSLGGDPT